MDIALIWGIGIIVLVILQRMTGYLIDDDKSDTMFCILLWPVAMYIIGLLLLVFGLPMLIIGILSKILIEKDS